MSKLAPNISVFFLWIAILAICAHLIIPHDHHLSESAAGQEESCPVSNGNAENHSGFPIHCHAFNDLTSERARTIINSQIIHNNVPELRSTSDSFQFGLYLACIKFEDIRILIPDSYYLKFPSLRAPPSLS
jgi:hypothetical protein